jgi:hypothetical protein
MVLHAHAAVAALAVQHTAVQPLLLWKDLCVKILRLLLRLSFVNAVPIQVFMFFKNDLGASSSVLGGFSMLLFPCCFAILFTLFFPGWSVVVTVIFEIPLMFWAPQVPSSKCMHPFSNI